MVRGDVHEYTPPSGRRGSEQRGRRYAVVVQSSDLAPSSTVVVAPTSASAAASFLQPAAEVRGRRTRVLVPQLGTVDPSRLGKRVERLSTGEMSEIDDALKLVLGLI